MCISSNPNHAVAKPHPNWLHIVNRVQIANCLPTVGCSSSINKICDADDCMMKVNKKTAALIIRCKNSRKHRTQSKKKHSSSIPKLVPVLYDTDDCNSTVSHESPSDSSFNGKESSEKKVTFCKRILVQEFRRLPGEEDATWYTSDEIGTFQREVISLVRQYNRDHWIAGMFRRPHLHLHSHPALRVQDPNELAAESRIKNIWHGLVGFGSDAHPSSVPGDISTFCHTDC